MALLRCINCGREYSGELEACPHCQYELKFVKCPECGRICAKEDSACGYCGCPVDVASFLPVTQEDADLLLQGLSESIDENFGIEDLESIERKLMLLGGYKGAADEAQRCRNRIEELEEQERIRSQYQRAVELLEKDHSPRTCETALGLLANTGDYENSEELRCECQSIVENHKKATRSRARIIGAICTASIAVILGAVLLISPCSLLGHKYDKGKVTVQPTCGTPGTRTFICERCGDTYTNPISSTGDHKWSDWETTEEATYDYGGTEERHCEVCGETETESIEKKERPASYYKDEEIINTDGKLLEKVYVMDGYISFNGSFSGSGNFIVEVLDYNQDLEELVCNEIGSYYLDKTVYVGTGWHYIQVLNGEGTWEMTWYGTGGD